MPAIMVRAMRAAYVVLLSCEGKTTHSTTGSVGSTKTVKPCSEISIVDDIGLIEVLDVILDVLD